MKKLDSLSKTLWCLLATIVFSAGSLMAQPANDDCDGATVTPVTVGGATVSISGDATGATDGPGFGAAHVWEAFTLDACADVTIDYCGTATDDLQDVFVSVADCPISFVINGLADSTSCGNGMWTISYTGLDAGTYYFAVMADPTLGGQGPYTININTTACPDGPANDEACGAISLPTDGTVGVYTNVSATVADGEDAITPPLGTDGNTSCDSQDGWCGGDLAIQNSVWFSFEATSEGVTISTCEEGTAIDTQVALYSATDCADFSTLTLLGANDDADPECAQGSSIYASSLSYCGLSIGTTYWILVDSYQGEQGDLAIAVSEQDCGSASFDCTGSTAIICDGFESYMAGDTIANVAAHWAPWPNFGYPSTVTDYRAADGTYSLRLKSDDQEDNLLLLGDQESGLFDVSFSIYIPADSSAYFNIQDSEATGTWNIDVFMNQDNANPGGGSFANGGAVEFNFPHDEWVDIHFSFNLDSDVATMSVNGDEVYNEAYTGNLGALNLYALGTTNTYYVDNVLYDGIILDEPCPAPAAIICDNFDFYDLGPDDFIMAPHWELWPAAGVIASNVSDEQAFSNANSLKVGVGPIEDQNLLLGDQTMGVWTVEFMMYVPAGNTGYYNMQNLEATGEWNFDLFMNGGGAGDYQENQASVQTFTYPEDQWFKMYHVIDLNNSTVRIELDDVEIHNGTYIGDQVGAINFYANGDLNTYYIDDVVVDGNPNVGITEYTEGLYTIYPNPTEGMITVQGEQQIDGVVVRDMLGAAVLRVESPFANRVNLDMSALETGVYFLEIQVGEQINVSRVVKK